MNTSVLREIINDFIADLHTEYLHENNEPMDGDTVENFCDDIKNRLDILNGNT